MYHDAHKFIPARWLLSSDLPVASIPPKANTAAATSASLTASQKLGHIALCSHWHTLYQYSFFLSTLWYTILSSTPPLTHPSSTPLWQVKSLWPKAARLSQQQWPIYLLVGVPLTVRDGGTNNRHPTPPYPTTPHTTNTTNPHHQQPTPHHIIAPHHHTQTQTHNRILSSLNIILWPGITLFCYPLLYLWIIIPPLHIALWTHQICS